MPTLQPSLKEETSKKKPRSNLVRIIAATLLVGVVVVASVVGHKEVPIGDLLNVIVNAFGSK